MLLTGSFAEMELKYKYLRTHILSKRFTEHDLINTSQVVAAKM